jgi:hypothetical protein
VIASSAVTPRPESSGNRKSREEPELASNAGFALECSDFPATGKDCRIHYSLDDSTWQSEEGPALSTERSSTEREEEDKIGRRAGLWLLDLLLWERRGELRTQGPAPFSLPRRRAERSEAEIAFPRGRGVLFVRVAIRCQGTPLPTALHDRRSVRDGHQRSGVAAATVLFEVG